MSSLKNIETEGSHFLDGWLPADDIRSYVRPPFASLTQLPPLTNPASKSCFAFTSWVYGFFGALIKLSWLLLMCSSPHGRAWVPCWKIFQLPLWHQKSCSILSYSFQNSHSHGSEHSSVILGLPVRSWMYHNKPNAWILGYISMCEYRCQFFTSPNLLKELLGRIVVNGEAAQPEFRSS